MKVRRRLALALAASLTTLVATARAQPQQPQLQPTASDVPKPPPITADITDPPLFADQNGLVFVRDRRDFVRLFPHAHLDVDAHGFFGDRVNELSTSRSGIDLAPRLFVRRARFDLGGELLERISFDGGLDLQNQPSIDGARVDGQRVRVALGDAWAQVDAGRGLYLRTGLYQSPVSIENRSVTSDLAMMERNVAIRGFVAPGGQVLAAALGGATNRDILLWDAGISSLSRLGPDTFEKGFDGFGRFTFQLATPDRSWGPLTQLDIGVSARAGGRNARDATEDAPAITTGQGFALWRPTQLDGAGQTVHVTPSGLQAAAGIELHAVLWRGLVLRSEGFHVWRHTRESVDPSAETPPARLGSIEGWGAYAELSWWVLQTCGLISGAAPTIGNEPHATHLELARTVDIPDRYGFELAALGALIRSSYATRDGSDALGAPRGDIDVYQVGLAANYWHTRRFRLSFNPNIYVVPGNGNLAQVPGELDGVSGARVLWEIAARTTVMF